MLKIVLPFLFSTSGLESSSKDIQAFSLETLLDIIKSSNSRTLRPYVPKIVGQLTGLLSSFEPEAINYLHLNADKYGVTTQQIDSARLTGVSQSPLMEAIERCLDALDADSMSDLETSLENAIKTSVGLPSKVGASRILVSLSTRHNFIFKIHADHFLKLTQKQLFDRNDTISSAYATACGYLARLASDAEILQLIHQCQKLYFDSDDDQQRVIAGNVVYAVSKHATDRFNALAKDVLPFVYVGQHDPVERAATLYKKTWDENVGGSRAVLLYLKDIINLASRYLDSPRWVIKHTSALAVAESVFSMGSEISDSNAKILWPVMEKAVGGKTWDGKEKVLKAFVKIAGSSNILNIDGNIAAQMQVSNAFLSRLYITAQEADFMFCGRGSKAYAACLPEQHLMSQRAMNLVDLPCIQKIMFRESKRNNAAYRQEALACLGEFIGMRADSDLFVEVLEIIRPVIDDALEESTEMDVDSTSGGLSSRPL